MMIFVAKTLKCFSIICADTNLPIALSLKCSIFGMTNCWQKNRITWIRVSMVIGHLLVDNALEVLLAYWLDLD